MILVDWNSHIAHLMQAHLHEISLAIVATCLVIYGDKVNGVLKKAISSWVFAARVIAFILMCTFGYGLLTLWSQPLVYWLISQVDFLYRPAFVVGCFCILGWIAERKRNL